MTLGDYHQCKVSGIESIQVRMFDGMVQTLTNVKHVPKLKKNLVSLGYLEQWGYSFMSHARSEVLNISKGVMVLMRGRRIENNLYKMEGSIVIRESDAATVTQDQQGAHRLWHYYLGHMGDCGMKELSKHGLISDLDGGILEVCEPCQMKK